MTAEPDGADRTGDIQVLCVDDDEGFRELLEEYLGNRQPDLVVETVDTGAAVLERLTQGGVDCVVSDYRMPRMDGLELLDEVRRDHTELPFIIYTGRGGEEIAADAVSAGVTEYIRKSTDPAQYELLANRIRNVVGRHRARLQYQQIFDAVSEALLVTDSSTERVVDANRQACDHWGYSHDDIVGRPLDDLRVTAESLRASTGDEGSTERWAAEVGGADGPTGTTTAIDPENPTSIGSAFPAAGTNGSAAGPDGSEAATEEWLCRSSDSTQFWGAVSRKQAEIDGRDRTLLIVRDVTRRKLRQRQLERLLDAVQDLLVVKTEAEIADTVTAVATETLRFANVTVFGQRSDGEFTPLGTDHADQPERVAEGEELDRLWDALEADDVVLPDAARRGGSGWTGQPHVYIPIGEVGVMRCETVEETDPYDIDLGALLATFAAGAFDRAGREHLLREREETLRTQRDELLSLNHVNEVIRDINRALVSVSSREGIERVVCEKFVATDRYVYAWLGDYTSSGSAVVPTASAGRGEGILPDRFEVDPATADPLSTAVTDRAVVVVDQISPQTVPRERYELARDRGFRSVAFVPIVHQNVLYRLLAVYADEPVSFSDREKAVLGELGETIGLALAAAEWRSTRISDTVLEIDLHVEHDGGLFGLTRRDGVRIDLVDLKETDRGTLRVFGNVKNTTFEAFESAVGSVVTLDDAVQLADREDALGVAFTIRAGPILETVKSGGVALREGTIAEGTGEFKLTVPTGTDVRWLVEQFAAAFDSVTLTGRRERNRSDVGERFESGLSSLTDRQEEVLRVAFHAGYFELPRTATGNDVAAILGISQPTFNEHLRLAQHRLMRGLMGV